MCSFTRRQETAYPNCSRSAAFKREDINLGSENAIGDGNFAFGSYNKGNKDNGDGNR